MGNRAVITTDETCTNGIGVYLHWNGGYDSVSAFLKYCELKGYRSPEKDSYGWARLCQVIGNFFGGSYSLGIDLCKNLDCANGDNGVYIIKDWKIIGRKFFNYNNEQNNYDLQEMLVDIDANQPEDEQFGEMLLCNEVPVSELKVGDTIYFREIDEKYYKHKIVGIGENKIVKGENVNGVPYVDVYSQPNGYASNINNYIRTDTVRKCTENKEKKKKEKEDE